MEHTKEIIDAQQTEIDQLKVENSKLQKEIKNHQKRNHRLESKYAELETDMENVKSNAGMIMNDISTY